MKSRCITGRTRCGTLERPFHSLADFEQNDIPVFCPALTDGSIGDMIFFHSFRNPGLIIDIVSDIRAINNLALKAKKAGMIILGGGVCKHQIANAMLMVSEYPTTSSNATHNYRIQRNGADYSVYIVR